MGFRSDLEALVLGVLDEEALHGYEIVKAIRARSNTKLKIGEGQLYPVLHKLEKSGAIQAEWVPQEGKPARKVYRLTGDGRKELDRQRKEWTEFVNGVSAVLGAKEVKHA